jgi:hypothetical protein
MELEAKKKTPRAREGFNKIIDIFSNSKPGTFITLCYLSSANIPKTLTGKNIDVDKFGTDIDNNLSPGTEAYKTLKAYQQGGASNKNKIPVGVVKSSIIQFHFQNEEGYGKKYGEFKDKVNGILSDYGAEPIVDRDVKHDETQAFGKGGVSVGSTDNTQGKMYTHQNGATANYLSTYYYLLNSDGNIFSRIGKEAINQILPKKSGPMGVSALKKINATDEQIARYIEEIKQCNFSVLKLMYDSILWVSATAPEGYKTFAINDSLADKIGSGSYAVNINPSQFVKLANSRYENAYKPLRPGDENRIKHDFDYFRGVPMSNESKLFNSFGKLVMESKNKKQRMRLTESELKQVIKEASLKILKNMLSEGRPFKNNQHYTHFAVSKKNGKILNGWDYKGYDPEELRQFKEDYFNVDLRDYGFDPKNCRILTYKYLVRNGLNPDDNSNWANNDEANADFVG